MAYFIGLLVVGLILYAEVTSRLRGFAVLKALGFPAGRLSRAVVLQTLLLVLIGLPIGGILAQVMAMTLEWAAPLYQVPVFEPFSLFRTAVASLIFATAGALVPLRRIRKTDPMLAFEGL